jgi:hypothetical protein
VTVSSLTGLGGLILVLAAVVFAVYAVFTDKRRATLTETYRQLYEAQKEATIQAKAEAEAERAARLFEQKECTARIAAVEGQLAVMQGNWIKSVAAGVAEAVGAYIKEQK